MKTTKKKTSVSKKVKTTKAKPITLDRKQAGRLYKNAHMFTSIKTAKKVFVNKQPISKTDATTQILQAIIDNNFLKMISDDPFDDIIDIEIR